MSAPDGALLCVKLRDAAQPPSTGMTENQRALRPRIVDGHLDIAYNVLSFGRDYTRPAAETRWLERGLQTVAVNGDTLLGWPEFVAGRVCVAFATLFAKPMRHRLHATESQMYDTFDEAHRLYRTQIEVYERLAAESPDKFRIVRGRGDLAEVLDGWPPHAEAPGPLGLVLAMEGGEAIRSIKELDEWHDLGVRSIGPAWVGTRYSGGWREPGPLTDEGRELLRAMAELGFILDLSHMDEPAALEALDSYGGQVIASHGNCLALLPGYPTNRQFSDRLLAGVIGRDGVVGLVPYNVYLKVGWTRESGRREEVGLEALVAHIDHVCQLAGDALHVGLGSDFDGGFGLQSAPAEVDTIADLQKLTPLLQTRGYTRADIENVLGGNWLRCLEHALPA